MDNLEETRSRVDPPEQQGQLKLFYDRCVSNKTYKANIQKRVREKLLQLPFTDIGLARWYAAA
jgi:type IV secretory pathway VirB4 component